MAKSKTKTYTTSDLAREFNISVVSASRFILKRQFKPVRTGNHNAKYYSSDVYQEMKKHYQFKPNTGVKQHKNATKDDIINQLTARVNEQAEIIKLLKKQLTIKDEQIATANKIADQAQQLDLTTHRQQKSLPEEPQANHSKDDNHGWFWKLTH
ncbi:DUF536 domain-containing protein [Limosilactobacillus vaginalis]|uniref:DUF536 domain-containing protein n=1 Tax=Limosilactobacillus vaginalis TaxID=1633 RepID=UPI003AB64E65